MKKILIATLLSLSVFATIDAQTVDQKMNVFVMNLMSKMTVDEKIGQLNLASIGADVTGPIISKDVDAKIKRGDIGGVFNLYTPAAVRKLQEMAVTQTRLKIPILFGYDVIHGYKTIFPIPLALSCSWDMDLIEQSARIAAAEASADGLNWTFSPMVDISRDPRWGRVTECGGEDAWLGSLIAKAMIKGYQGDGKYTTDEIMACVKHFALYGAVEAGRDYNTVDMSMVKMYNDYLPPYKAAIDAGAASVMTSFNEINGIPSSANKWLLTDLLHKQWGFKGFVVTDYTAINEMIQHGIGKNEYEVGALAMHAGVDMDMVGEVYLLQLKKLLTDKKVSMAEIDVACKRILEAKYKLGLFADPYRYINEQRAQQVIMKKDFTNAARNIARHSIVLLKNNNQTLPLKKTGTIALIGPLVKDQRDLIGSWSGAGEWDKLTTLQQAMDIAVGSNAKIIYAKGANFIDDDSLINRLNSNGAALDIDNRSSENMIAEAVKTAQQADVIVAVVGEPQAMSGEATSRSDIGLPGHQEELLKALKQTGKPLIVVLMNGRPLTLNWEDKNADAILETWFGGTEATPAIAAVLFGDYNPSGKLTMTFPQNVGQIPIYYNHKNTGRPYAGDFYDKYKSRYLDVTNDPLYPFGYGLSYTTFAYSNMHLSDTILTAGKNIKASITVTNTGKYDGEETVQLYTRQMDGSITRPVKELKGFQKIFLKAGESKQVDFTIRTNDLKFFNADLKYGYEPGNFKIFIGTNSRDVEERGFYVK